MKFFETSINGAFIIEPDLIEDERGFFARSWCQKEFIRAGLNPNIVQCNISFNNMKGTIRGMHFQAKPHQEAKLVSCTQGAIYDVIIDIRTTSSTYKRWFAVELTAENYKMLYIPEGVAHGYQTLVGDSNVFYQMSEYFHSKSAKGIRWNDPLFNIDWPIMRTIISDKDLKYPNWGIKHNKQT